MFMRENHLCDTHSKMLHKVLTFKSYKYIHVLMSKCPISTQHTLLLSLAVLTLSNMTTKLLNLTSSSHVRVFLVFHICHLADHKNCCVSFFFFIIYYCAVPVGTFINCARRPCFRASARGIGYSFQLAITTPRMNLIGYGTATALS